MKTISKQNETPDVKILESVLKEIRNTIGSRPAESGGLLFGNQEDMIVRDFVFDKQAETSPVTYTFNVKYLNSQIKKMWNEKNYSCLGFIHSHPYGIGRPSSPDIQYFSSMFESMPRKYYITPIIFTEPDGGFLFNTYIIFNGQREAIKTELVVLKTNEELASVTVSPPAEKNNKEVRAESASPYVSSTVEKTTKEVKTEHTSTVSPPVKDEPESKIVSPPVEKTNNVTKSESSPIAVSPPVEKTNSVVKTEPVVTVKNNVTKVELSVSVSSCVEKNDREIRVTQIAYGFENAKKLAEKESQSKQVGTKK